MDKFIEKYQKMNVAQQKAVAKILSDAVSEKPQKKKTVVAKKKK